MEAKDDIKLNELVTVADAAKMLDVAKKTIYKYVAKGYISAERYGNTIMIKRPEIERVLNTVPKRATYNFRKASTISFKQPRMIEYTKEEIKKIEKYFEQKKTK